jgi:hypothetical protein
LPELVFELPDFTRIDEPHSARRTHSNQHTIALCVLGVFAVHDSNKAKAMNFGDIDRLPENWKGSRESK